MDNQQPQLTKTIKYTILLETGEDTCFVLRSLLESEEIPFQYLVGKFKILNVFNTILDATDGKLIVPINKLRKVQHYLAMFSNGLLGSSVNIKISAEIEEFLNRFEASKKARSFNTGEGLAEIVLDDGYKGETAAIPARTVNLIAARPVRRENEYVTLKDLGYKVRRGASNSTYEFLKEAERLSGYEGEAAERIQFSCYYPTYEAMTEKQQKWYFWWRQKVRRREYPETDLSYIFVHIYELINQIGTRDPRDGYMQLADLWHHYRNTYPKLDSYMSIWIHDYIVVYSCEFTERDAATLLSDCKLSGLSIDWIIKYFSDRPFDQVPFKLFLYLSDFPLQNSKFYFDGENKELESLFSIILSRADIYLQAVRGKGILSYFSPGADIETKRFPFPGAVYNNASSKTINVAVNPYSTYEPIRKFITTLMKQTENKLREVHKVKGRLKCIDLEPDIQQFVDSQLNAAIKKQKKEASKIQISVDQERVMSLLQDSDWVRDRLLEGIADLYKDTEPDPAVPNTKQDTSINNKNSRPGSSTPDERDYSDIPEEWKEFLQGLEDYQIAALSIISKNEYEEGKASLSGICEQYLILPQMLIDTINSAAIDIIGDLIIDTNTASLEPVISDEYKDIVYNILR